MRPGIPSVAFGIFNLELGSFWFDKEPEESGLNYLEYYLWGKMSQKRGWCVFPFQLPESVIWLWVVSVVCWGRWRWYEGTWKVSAILKPTQSLWKSLLVTQAWFGHYLTPMIRHKPIKSSKILLACFFFHPHGPVPEPWGHECGVEWILVVMVFRRAASLFPALLSVCCGNEHPQT